MIPARHLSSIMRWGACFLLVLGAHAAAAVVLLAHWRAPADAVASAPAVLVDLAPAPAAPAAASTQLPPGPMQPQAQAQAAPEKKIEKADIAPAPETSNEKTESKPTPETPIKETTEPEPAPVHEQVETLAMLPPPRPHIEPKARKRRAAKARQQRASLAHAPSAAERRARRTSAPAPGASRPNSDAIPNWKSRLLARLERYKRYPAEAQQRGEQGVAQLAFSVDPAGGVHNAHIARSSGSALLDHATLELVQRAQPLPPPPAALGRARVSIVVPIRYNIR
jgi:protein TonB